MLTAQHLLDSIGGPAYVVADDERIIQVGRRGWHSQVDDAPATLDPDALIGRNLFDFIQGNAVKDLYREILAQLRTHPDSSAELLYRCDSPGMMREYRLTIAAVAAPEDGPCFLFASHPINRMQRPKLPLFAYQRFAGLNPDPDLPLVAICSFCHRVRSKHDNERDDSAWIEPEQYYQAGGSSRVQLSHGVCPSCYTRWRSDTRQR
jgi:hypothetical protein